MVDENVKSG